MILILWKCHAIQVIDIRKNHSPLHRGRLFQPELKQETKKARWNNMYRNKQMAAKRDLGIESSPEAKYRPAVPVDQIK